MIYNEYKNLMRILYTLSEILKGKEETKHVIEQYEYNKKVIEISPMDDERKTLHYIGNARNTLERLQALM